MRQTWRTIQLEPSVLKPYALLSLPPAERIAVLKTTAVNQSAFLFQYFNDVLICILKRQNKKLSLEYKFHYFNKLLQDLSPIPRLRKALQIIQHLHTQKFQKVSIQFMHLLQRHCKSLHLESYLLYKSWYTASVLFLLLTLFLRKHNSVQNSDFLQP